MGSYLSDESEAHDFISFKNKTLVMLPGFGAGVALFAKNFAGPSFFASLFVPLCESIETGTLANILFFSFLFFCSVLF